MLRKTKEIIIQNNKRKVISERQKENNNIEKYKNVHWDFNRRK